MKQLNSTPLGTLGGALQGGLNNLVNTGSSYLDRFFPPERRNEVKAKLMKFATEKPMFASFIFSQIAISGLPLALFAVFTVGVCVFALLGALIIAVLGAVLFTVVMAGFALIILLPTLFITTFSAAFIWLWGVGAYYLVKWFNDKPVPGIHTSLKDGAMDATGLNTIQDGINNADNADKQIPPPHEQDASQRKDLPPSQKPKQPQPLNEKKDSANATNKQQQPRNESPSAKNPSRANIAKSTSIEQTGGDIKKKTTGGLSGVTTAATGITA